MDSNLPSYILLSCEPHRNTSGANCTQVTTVFKVPVRTDLLHLMRNKSLNQEKKSRKRSGRWGRCLLGPPYSAPCDSGPPWACPRCCRCWFPCSVARHGPWWCPARCRSLSDRPRHCRQDQGREWRLYELCLHHFSRTIVISIVKIWTLTSVFMELMPSLFQACNLWVSDEVHTSCSFFLPSITSWFRLMPLIFFIDSELVYFVHF